MFKPSKLILNEEGGFFPSILRAFVFSKAEVWDGPFDGGSPWGPFKQEWDLPPLRYIYLTTL